MRRNLTRLMAVVLAAGGLALTAAPRSAGAVSLNLINDWKMGDVATLGNTNGTGGLASFSYAGAIGTTGVIPRLGVNFHLGIGFGRGDQVVPFLGFNMDRVQIVDDVLWDEDGDGDEDDQGVADASIAVFGLEIGAKFFLVERAKGKAPPFILVSFHKYFAGLNAYSDDTYAGPLGDYEDIGAWGDIDDDNGAAYIAYDNARHSPLGFKFAFGAEYYFNDNFSLGGTFFGMEFNYARANLYISDAVDQFTTTNEFNFYTSLNMTYRFAFTMRASVQFESDYDYED